MKKLTILKFFERYPTQEACLDHLFNVRYGNDFVCPACKKAGKWYQLTNRRAFTCQWCGHHEYPCVGTPFEKSRTDLRLWFYAIYLFTASRHGVPAKELERQLGVTYKCAWRMAHVIREHMAEVDGDRPLSGHVEVDETYFGGRVRGKGRGLQMENKTVVIGMSERGGDVILWTADAARKKAIHARIRKDVVPGTFISADESPIYDDLHGRGYKVGRVNHSKKEWARGTVHTNTIESVWAQLKRSISGTHISVSKKHLSKYVAEFEYRWNARHRPKSMLPELLSTFRPLSEE